MRNNLAKRSDRLSVLLFSLFILFVSVIIWTHVAGKDTIRPFYYYQLDKVIHFLAGWWVVVILLEKLRLRGSKTVFLLICAAVLWEFFEVTFFPDVNKIYIEKYVYWLKDTLGDLGAGLLGGIIAFRVFSREK